MSAPNHPLIGTYPPQVSAVALSYPTSPPPEGYPPYPQGQATGQQPAPALGFAVDTGNDTKPNAKHPGYPIGPAHGVPSLPSVPGYPMDAQSSGCTQVVSNQPVAGDAPATQPLLNPQDGWMTIPVGSPHCPRGLEYLTTIDQLLVKQRVKKVEFFSDVEKRNRFIVMNALGQKVYYAIEESDSCMRDLCGSSRDFIIRIYDNFRNEVMHLRRPRNSLCGSPGDMEVSAPPGNVIGTIGKEHYSLSKVTWDLMNSVGDEVLRLEAPLVGCFLSSTDLEIKVLSLTGEIIGKITNQWAGFIKEFFTDADNFGITFPLDLDVHMKALLLAATFLIDITFFEDDD